MKKDIQTVKGLLRRTFLLNITYNNILQTVLGRLDLQRCSFYFFIYFLAENNKLNTVLFTKIFDRHSISNLY